MNRTKIEVKNKKFLYQKYIIEKMTHEEIAKLVGIPKRTIHSWLIKFNIPRRKPGVEHWSEEQKELRRKWNKNHPEINRMKGKNHSAKTKLKMSMSRTGFRNANWKGGLTQIKRGIKRSPQYYQWRKDVLKRDGEICCNCGRPNSREAHHIKPVKEYPELIFNINNGLTFCVECHKKVHFGGGVLFNIHALNG
jgi:hypothetical protein